MEKILITGCRGFLGREVVRVLTESHEIYGISRNNTGSGNVVFDIDITNFDEFTKCVETISPDVIIHLAASTKGPNQEMFRNNIVGFRNLLKIVCDLKGKKKLQPPLIISANSCAIFDPAAALPLVETSSYSPSSYYGLTKLINIEDAQQYSKSYNIRIVSLIFFNFSGPNQSEDYVISAFCKQVAEIKLGFRKSVVHAGGLGNIRDFVDVRDAAFAVESVVKKAHGITDGSELFNICSGVPTRVSEVIKMLSGISGVSFKVVEDHSHKSVILKSFGDFKKFHSRFGWKPTISIRKSIEDNYHFWLQQMKG